MVLIGALLLKYNITISSKKKKKKNQVIIHIVQLYLCQLVNPTAVFTVG